MIKIKYNSILKALKHTKPEKYFVDELDFRRFGKLIKDTIKKRESKDENKT